MQLKIRSKLAGGGGLPAGWLLLTVRGKSEVTVVQRQRDKGGEEGVRREGVCIGRLNENRAVWNWGGEKRCGGWGRESEKRWKKRGWGERGEGKNGEIPFPCGAIVALFSLQSLERFPSYQLEGCKHLREFFSIFFFFFFLRVLKHLVRWNQTFGACIFGVFRCDWVVRLINIWRWMSFNNLYNIIFNILGWSKIYVWNVFRCF